MHVLAAARLLRTSVPRAAIHASLAASLALSATTVVSVQPTLAAQPACYVNEAGTPYRPAGTKKVSAWGDARCSVKVYELRVWVQIYRSTNGGGSWSLWADGPWDAYEDPPLCNYCSYKAATLKKSCSATALYKSYVFAAWMVNWWDDPDDMLFLNRDVWSSGLTKSISC